MKIENKSRHSATSTLQRFAYSFCCQDTSLLSWKTVVLVLSGPSSSSTRTAGPKQHICATGRYLLQEKEERSASQGSVYFLHIQREAASADLCSLLNVISDCLACAPRHLRALTMDLPAKPLHPTKVTVKTTCGQLKYCPEQPGNWYCLSSVSHHTARR